MPGQMGALWKQAMAAVAVARLVAGAAFEPVPTLHFAGRLPVLGFSPAPTPAPFAGLDVAELFKRDPTNTCAYLLGQSGTWRMFLSLSPCRPLAPCVCASR